jgi:hypothetical protein
VLSFFLLLVLGGQLVLLNPALTAIPETLAVIVKDDTETEKE